MNVSTLRQKFGELADQIEESIGSGMDNASVINYMQAMNIPMQRIEYDGGFYSRFYYAIKDDLFLDGITPQLFSTQVNNLSKEDLLSYYIFMKQNKMLRVAAYALHYWVDSLVSPVIKSMSSGSLLTIEHKTEAYSKDLYVSKFRSIANNGIPKDYYRLGLRDYAIQLNEIEKWLGEGKHQQKRGLVEYFENKPSKVYLTNGEINVIEDQIKAAYRAMPSNGLTNRTWGFELEIADAKGVNAPFGIDKGEDGSLRSYEASEDCDCDCDDCTYHDCDCDWCENRNTDPDHCGSSSCTNADSAEFRSKNGISRLKHAGLFKLCAKLDEVYAEVNDTCGVHIHVYAADLEPEQVASVLASYKWLENIMAAIAGRDDTSYARRLTVKDIATAFKDKKFNPTKQQAVNVMHMGMQGDRGTIEFRQMLGNYNAERITFWSWLVRGLVTTAKRGAKLHHFRSVQDINDIIGVFASFNYYLHDEGTELLIPGGKLDNDYIKRNSLQRVTY